MAGWYEKHPDVLPRMERSHRGPQRDRLGDRGIKVTNVKVEVDDRALSPLGGRPGGSPVAGRLLEHEIDGSLGSGQYGRSWFLVPDGPAEQLGVEPRQGAGVGRFDSGPPPHAARSRSHACSLPQGLSRVLESSLKQAESLQPPIRADPPL